MDAERAQLLRRSVELPDGFIDNEDVREAISRAAKGHKLWPLMAIGKGAAKALVGNVRVDGASPREEDAEAWRHVATVIDNSVRQREDRPRWDGFATEINAPTGANAKSAINLAGRLLQICDDAKKKLR